MALADLLPLKGEGGCGRFLSGLRFDLWSTVQTAWCIFAR